MVRVCVWSEWVWSCYYYLFDSGCAIVLYARGRSGCGLATIICLTRQTWVVLLFVIGLIVKLKCSLFSFQKFLSDRSMFILTIILVLPVLLTVFLWTLFDGFEYSEIRELYPCPGLVCKN